MKLTVFALKNLRRNFSFYSLYLFSVSVVLMTFFCFTSFSMNEAILEKISADGRVETMSRTIAALIVAFVIFYMFYANKFFMRRRMHELGIYALLGYRKSAILALLTFENAFVCLGSLLVGIVTGGLLHKAVTAGVTALLGLTIDNGRVPLFDAGAIKLNLIFVAAVLLTLTLSNAKLLWRSTLLQLVRLEKKVEKPVRPSGAVALMGAGLLLCGYALALDMMRGRRSVWYTVGFSPIALLTMVSVVSGTALFIYSFLPYACRQIRHRRSLLYRENTIVVIPKFMHRIRLNAKSIILLILMTAGTLSIFGATVLSIWYPYRMFGRIIPSAVEFRVTDDRQLDASLLALRSAVDESRLLIRETVIVKTTASSERLPAEYHISRDKGRAPGFECISQADYEALLAQQGKQTDAPALSDAECLLIKYRPDPDQTDIGALYCLQIGDAQTANVTVVQTSLDNPIGFGNSVGTLVVSNALYRRLMTGPMEQIRVLSVNGHGMRKDPAPYEALHAAMPDNIYLVSAYQREAEFFNLNSSTLLLICFVTVIFLIATGSILYFQNLSSVAYDKPDYEILQRMGYDDAMIKRCIRRQIQIYFMIPYVLGLVHSAFAIVCYKYALMDDLLGDNAAVAAPVLLAAGIFSAVYLVYYLVTKRSCYRVALGGALE